MAIPLNDLYDYPKLSRETVDGKRIYVTPTREKLPSVTTILDATADKTHLVEWRKRVGAEEATKQTQQAAAIGNILHNSLEKYILGEEYIFKKNLIHNMAKKMSKNLIEKSLSHITEVYGTEINLYYPGLYAGTADLIAAWGEEISILDFKNSKKIKKREWIEDYFMQGCAYAMAHNKLYGTNIKQVVICMTARPDHFPNCSDLPAENFILKGNEFDSFTDKWLDRLDQFYSMT